MPAARPAPDALTVVAQPRRRAILRLVWDAERTAGELAAALDDVTFGAVSQHLRVLREAGLVVVRVDGRRRWYRADHARLGPLARALEAGWADRLTDLKRLAEQRQQEHDP